MITVAYKNIGRNKVCDIIDIDVSKKEEAEYRELIAEKIAKEAKKFLMSRDIEAIEYEKNKFKIYAGVQMVGTTQII